MSQNKPKIYACKTIICVNHEVLQDKINDFIETLDDFHCIDVKFNCYPFYPYYSALIFYKGEREKTSKKESKKEEECQPTEKKKS